MSSFVPLKKRLAIIVSHPVQYYAPLYQRLARRTDLEIKVFFTWHAGQAAVEDHEFKTPVAWDIPLTEGYEFELVPNISSKPGTDRFWGLRNPSLVQLVTAWLPEIWCISPAGRGSPIFSHCTHFTSGVSGLFFAAIPTSSILIYADFAGGRNMLFCIASILGRPAF